MAIVYFLSGLLLAGVVACVVYLRARKNATQMFEQQLQSLTERKDAELRVATARLQSDVEHAEQTIQQLKSDAAAERDRLVQSAERRVAEVKEDAAKTSAEAMAAQKRLFDEQLAKMREEIKISTVEALRHSQDELKKANSESVGTLLEPIHKEMENVRKLMGETEKANTESTSRLAGALEQMMNQTTKISKEANNLADALKNRGKVHGDWGEQVLADILQGSGLREGIEFSCQESFKGEHGNELRPDVVINCPDGKRIVVDSKVSLTAYTDALGAENEIDREDAIRRNAKSVKAHVDELEKKLYAHYVPNALNYVLMFIPNEGAYVMAMNHDSSLAQYGFRKGIIIVNPTNLMLSLQLILQTWQQTRQEDNCKKIIDVANGLYEKVIGAVDTCVRLGSQLDTAHRTYGELDKQLQSGTGNVLRRVEGLRDLGVTSTKRPKRLLSPVSELSVLSEPET